MILLVAAGGSVEHIMRNYRLIFYRLYTWGMRRNGPQDGPQLGLIRATGGSPSVNLGNYYGGATPLPPGAFMMGVQP